MKWAAVLAMLVASLPAASANAAVRTYAIVIANNYSLDPKTPPLRYADDDGAKTWELFSLFATRASLFAVLDADTSAIHPEATAHAEIPEHAAIVERLRVYNEAMAADVQRGDEPELFFIYAGHGDVAPDGQGYINLQDGKLFRRDLYREVIAPSNARFVHVIIDACQSYFMVKSRGAWRDDAVSPSEDRSGAVHDFLAEEELEHYPRAGVIVATSGAGESHEWSRYRSGILSHEIRSALSGAADINGDGRIEYSELHAFLGAANARISNPDARMDVFMHAPALDRHRPLVDLRRAATSEKRTRFLRFSAGVAGQFHLEDERGLRYADWNKDPALAFDVIVPSRRTIFVRQENGEEAEVSARAPARVEISALKWHARPSEARGALDSSFRANLFHVTYGRGFYDGFIATSGEPAVAETTDRLEVSSWTPVSRNRVSAGYLFSSSRVGDSGMSHGADLRYARQLRGVDIGLAGQIGYGGSDTDTHLLHFALLGTLGAELHARPWLLLRVDGSLGWQLLSGMVHIGGVPLAGTEARGLRMEAGGGVGFAVHPKWVLWLRGGFALDAVFPSGRDQDVAPGGYLTVAAQVRP